MRVGPSGFVIIAFVIAVHLINDIHGEVLCRPSSSADLHFVGLTVGGSLLRSLLGPRLTKKLKQVDVAHTVLRHIKAVYTQQLMHEVLVKRFAHCPRRTTHWGRGHLSDRQ